MLIERSHFVIGLVVGALLLGGSVYALGLQAGALATGNDVVVELADADRVESGSPVRIAGVRVGQVMGVEIAGEVVEVTIRTGEPLPVDTRARVTTTNALGARAITLDTGDDWGRLLEEQDEPRIPLEQTEAFVDLPDVTDEAVAVLEEADAEAAARLFTSLADVTDDQHEELGDLLDGLEAASDVVEDNRAELATFLDDTGELLDVLNDADRDLLRTIDGVGETVAALDARRDDLLEMVRSTASFSATTADLVTEERETIDAILDEVAALLALVDDHQVDLAHILGYGGVAFEGFSSVGQSQGEDNEYWGNILTSGAGVVGIDVVGGCGGLLDEVLDQLLGPGPECPPEEQSLGRDEDQVSSPLESPGADGADGADGGTSPHAGADAPAPRASAGEPRGAGDALRRFLGTGGAGDDAAGDDGTNDGGGGS